MAPLSSSSIPGLPSLSFLSLPEDILIAIICTTTPLDTLSLSKTCTHLWRLAVQRVVWLRLYDLYVLKEGLADTLGRSKSSAPLSSHVEHDEKHASWTQALIKETVASYTLAQRWRHLNKTVPDSYNSLRSTSGPSSGFTTPPPPDAFVPRSRPTFAPLQSTHIVPTLSSDLTSNPTFIKFIDIGDLKYSGRLVLTVSRVIWLVVQVWDVGAGARREGIRGRLSKGKEGGGSRVSDVGGEAGDDDVVAKNCLCQWSTRGASFSGIAVNQEGDRDGTVAIGLLHEGRHDIQILKLRPPSSASITWTLKPVFTLSNIGMDLYPVSLIGPYLCVANARDQTEIIHWKKNRRGLLKESVNDVHGGGTLQYNKCSQVLLIPDTNSILVIRARSVHLFRWPNFYPIVEAGSGHQNANDPGGWFGFSSSTFAGPAAQTPSAALTTPTPTSNVGGYPPTHDSVQGASISTSVPSLASTATTSSATLSHPIGNLPIATMQPPMHHHPQNQPSVAPTAAPQPEIEIERSIASYSFGWVDCITATLAAHPLASTRPSTTTQFSGHSNSSNATEKSPRPIYIFFRGTLDDPWANDDTKLEVWVVEGNPDWDPAAVGVKHAEDDSDDEGDDDSEGSNSSTLGDSASSPAATQTATSVFPVMTDITQGTTSSTVPPTPSPYLFPPTPLPSLSLPTPRGPLLCPTLILGPNMTGVWIEPKERIGRVGGMVVDYDGMGAGLGAGRLVSGNASVDVSMGGGARVFAVSDDIGPRRRGLTETYTAGSSSSLRSRKDDVLERWREVERQRKSEKVMAVAFPGPFYGRSEMCSGDGGEDCSSSAHDDTTLSTATRTHRAPRQLQVIHNSSSSNWSAIDYDEDRGRVVVASSVRGFVVVDL